MFEKKASYILPIFPLPWQSRGSGQTRLSRWACGTCLSWFTWFTLKEIMLLSLEAATGTIHYQMLQCVSRPVNWVFTNHPNCGVNSNSRGFCKCHCCNLEKKSKKNTKTENKENEKARRKIGGKEESVLIAIVKLGYVAAAAGLKWIQRLLCWNNNGGHTRSHFHLCAMFTLNCQNHSEHSLNSFKITFKPGTPMVL